MSNVIQFPERATVRVIDGINVKTGAPVYLLEYVSGESRTIVSEYSSLVDLAYGILEWETEGVQVIDTPGGAA